MSDAVSFAEINGQHVELLPRWLRHLPAPSCPYSTPAAAAAVATGAGAMVARVVTVAAPTAAVAKPTG